MAADSEVDIVRPRTSSAYLALGAVILPFLVYFVYGLWQNGKKSQAALVIRGRTPPTALSPVSTSPALGIAPGVVQNPAQREEVVVHVVGAVARPGVYRLSPDKRVVDAVKAAGGPAPNADVNAINLAARLEDGTRIELPLKVQAAQEDIGPIRKSDTAPKGKAPPSPISAKAKAANGEKVNINTADAEQLQRLPGVGPAMADRIVTHRKENGPFSDAEQLMDVSGIGEKKYAKMREFVRIR